MRILTMQTIQSRYSQLKRGALLMRIIAALVGVVIALLIVFGSHFRGTSYMNDPTVVLGCIGAAVLLIILSFVCDWYSQVYELIGPEDYDFLESTCPTYPDIKRFIDSILAIRSYITRGEMALVYDVVNRKLAAQESQLLREEMETRPKSFRGAMT